MIKHHKRKLIFKVILVKIFIIVIALSIILAGMIMREIQLMQEDLIETKKESLKNEVLSLVEYMNSTFESLEKIFYISQRQIADELIEIHKKVDLKSFDLTRYLEKVDIDPEMHDIYIIENNIVINSTKKQDIDWNLKEFGQEFIDFMQYVADSGKFIQARFMMESETKRIKSYSYIPTIDKKYIVEIGSYSEIADNMMEMFKKRLNIIISENKEVVSANVWIP